MVLNLTLNSLSYKLFKSYKGDTLSGVIGLNNDSHRVAITVNSKQKASVKWLLSKAFNNRVPENLREPFYRDHEEQEHLKPQIVAPLANAELYCLALGNIYSDPNYHSLNHWSILQTLSRKGVPVTSSTESNLTETVLIQTNPLRISAHMAVIESIMILYAKEVVTPDRVIAAIQRFSGSKSVPATQQLVTPADHEAGLMMWVNHACSALRNKISQEVGSSNGSDGDRPKVPELPVVHELKDLCDGVALAALVSFYCPDSLPWSRVQVSYLPTVQESIHNLILVSQFSQQCLPYPVFHMMPEDITYMRGAMKQNLVVFLADLFNVLEIHPAKCVRFSGMEQPMAIHPARNSQGVAHKRIMPPAPPAPIPDLRSGIDAPNTAFTGLSSVTKSPSISHVRRPHTASPAPSDPDPEESFPIHRGRTVPTLSSIHNEEPLVPAKLRQAKEKSNHDSKADERGDGRNVPAGRPSNWEDTRRSSYAGRRSRRNSITDDSQLTIENFGGSQDQLNFIGRNPDKELGGHVGRKISNTQEPKAIYVEPNVAVRSSVKDARGSIQLSYDSPDSGSEKQDNEREKSHFGKLRRTQSIETVSLKNILHSKETDDADGDMTKLSSFADIKKAGENKGINLLYMQENDENSSPPEYSMKKTNGNEGNGSSNGNGNGGGDKRTSFATLPNTTTWQQQSNRLNQNNDSKDDEDAPAPGVGMASQLNNIRLKLEEKRRHIESEKRRMEAVMSKQRQKVGKAAFLQAVTKSKSGIVRTPPESREATGPQRSPSAPNCTVVKPQRPFSLKEISDDAHSVEHKWLEQDGSAPFVETRRTPDLECMNLDQYHESIAKMNSSLHDIQADIQRLASQQNQIQASQQQSQILAQHHQLAALANQQNSIPGYRHSDLLQMQGSIINSNLFKSQGNLHHVPQSLTSQHQIMNFGSQHNVNMQPQMNYPSQLHQNFGSNPHINTYTQPLNIITSPRLTQEAPQFYLHEQQTPTPRRTWAQQAAQPPPVDTRTYKSPAQSTGFVLHDTTERYHPERYQNGDHSLNNHNTYNQQVYNMHSSPQHRNSSVHRQISQMIGDGDAKPKSPINLQRLESAEKPRSPTTMHIPLASPPVDDMAPQSISFIGNDEDDVLNSGIGKLNITSGSRTYRIPSPTRPSLNRNSFHQPLSETPPTEVHSLEQEDNSNEKGFYISFDNEQPKRPKPPLRVKRASPKKERGDSYIENIADREQYINSKDSKRDKISQLEFELERERERQQQQQNRYQEQQQYQPNREMNYERVSMEPLATAVPTVKDFKARDRHSESSQERDPEAIIIGNDFSNPDPNSVEEMERKKEKIMLLQFQRKQEQEASKARKEKEAMQKRERDKLKDEEKARKKEEQAQRRAQILEQYKLKKAIEEAEREGKVIDKSELMSAMKPQPKMRPKGATTGRPRPKTIHVDSGSVELAEGMLTPSRGKKGSSSNLTGLSNQSTMRRDYYRGSQDSLAGTHSYRESPDDCSGASPGRSTNPTLGRRGSYKTSRDDVSTPQTRGRPKYPTYQSNFKGRKSNSLMNLCDTDSGLGRATPPRRAPSPGMGPMRHLPSPSGPGSLPPGLMGKRRVYDDGSSDISSSASSMMDYTGPRLYKQPATKSNRGIMLNAVEYCVFPGVVNKEAKRRVLEEIARSESKHFLILFRDAGCQFRALYSYCPDGEEVVKLYGTGPKQVNDRMFDKFFKYNSGGKCFSQVHTKHLTVTIDAFTIHNSLWQGKKVNLPSKKDMTLVI